MDETDWEKVCFSALRMPAEEFAQAELTVAADPEALEARVKLIGALRAVSLIDHVKRATFDAHVHWMITHHPEIGLGALGGIRSYRSPRGYAEAKRLWLEAVGQRPTDTRVLWNATMFTFIEDDAIAEELVKRGIELAPSARWHSTLASIYEERAWTASPEERATLATLIVEQHEKALDLTDDVHHRYHHRIGIARWAVETKDEARARHHATLVLEKATLDGARSNDHGPYWAHIVLGKIALIENDMTGACAHLTAVSAPCPPFDMDFIPEGRPDLSLAAGLLERGARGPVTEYLVALEALWPEKSAAVRAKREEVERGESSDLEDIHAKERERQAALHRFLRERAREGG